MKSLAKWVVAVVAVVADVARPAVTERLGSFTKERNRVAKLALFESLS